MNGINNESVEIGDEMMKMKCWKVYLKICMGMSAYVEKKWIETNALNVTIQ